MSLTPSSMLPLGTEAPDFTLPDPVKGGEKRLAELKSDRGTVVLFICNHCPFVKHVQQKLVDVANEYISKGISFVAINANDVANYPDDSPGKMKDTAEQFGYPFPYLFDESQKVAKAYQAACTPDLYLFDGNLKLVYRGQFDDSRPGNDIPVTGQDLRSAMDHLLQGKPVNSDQMPSMGCNIKWK
jgi:thiol-disulfide isomerase/thioredoxin